jgi:HD superfamily phosphohydrolase
MSRGPIAVSFRDPVHGFIRADPLEKTLIDSRPLQRLRHVHQLAFTHLVFPGAEHSRFSHILGAMELAGRVYDSLAAKPGSLLDPDPRSPERRLVRVAALLHDIGHAPFSHSAEELFEDGIHHEEMTLRLIQTGEVEEVFRRQGDSLSADRIVRLLSAPRTPTERLLSQIISGELDVDKMDYLLRDSLFCGVRYGSYDLPRLLDTMVPLEDPETGELGIGVEEGGVHALEALVMARYYMFTQVYFNVTGKALELHFNEWLRESDRRWPSDPARFLAHDDVSVLAEMRGSRSVHARALVERRHYPLVLESKEHLTVEEKSAYEALISQLVERFGSDRILISNSAKDPHRMGSSRVLVRRFDGELEPMERASHFIRHLGRIDRYRIYASPDRAHEVEVAAAELWTGSGDGRR